MNSSIGVAESRQEERRKLKELSNRDDLFDVWVRMVLSHIPSIYVFINITLLIWVAQSIQKSSLSTAPKSIYLVAPLLTTGPINNIVPTRSNKDCPAGTEMLVLRSTPTIVTPNIPQQVMTSWGDEGVQFCVGRLGLYDRLVKGCPQGKSACSGYCVQNRGDCPITGVRALGPGVGARPREEKFLTMDSKDYYFTRDENPPIVSIIAAFSTKCANDQHYNEVFSKEADYWAAVTNCGSEGTISSFFTKFDSMETNSFLANNKVHMAVKAEQLQALSLGTIEEFILSDLKSEGCQNAKAKSQKIQPYLQRGAVGPQFTQSLLIIGFILLIAQIGWLVVYYCFDGCNNEKSVFVVLISIIELVIISFMYTQNKELFYIEELSVTLAKCLKQSLPAMNHWHFGIDSPQSFRMVIFINTVFLLLFLLIYLINHCCFRELRRRQLVAHNAD